MLDTSSEIDTSFQAFIKDLGEELSQAGIAFDINEFIQHVQRAGENNGINAGIENLTEACGTLEDPGKVHFFV